MKNVITIEQSGAFIEVFDVKPTGSGILDGLTCAIKDLIDIAGHPTGCGNPTWRETHPLPTAHAVCVEQLLAAGARTIGKTITDEVAFSLIGENDHYGTPLNPKAQDRVPGGSSSGSASAVACDLVDFALGTDTGGSVRVPAANCGILGYRPTHDRIPLAGVCQLAPSLDTVGVFARTTDVLVRVASVLLGIDVPKHLRRAKVYLIREALDVCDEEVRRSLQPAIDALQPTAISLQDIVKQPYGSKLDDWREVYRVLLQSEAECSLGAWIAQYNPKFGPLLEQSINAAHHLDRSLIPQATHHREILFQQMLDFIGPEDLVCIPTIPAPAPLKNTILKREHSGNGYYPRALAVTSVAGVARLPQITLPVAEISGAPLGLSLIARHRQDEFLLGVVKELKVKELNV
jgi:amidase